MNISLIEDLEHYYGVTCSSITPVMGGYLNKKWKVSTGQGDLLVKQFSPQRFGREKLKLIEEALQRQIFLYQNGGPCPAVRQCHDRAIRRPDPETAYVVMDFDPGKSETPGTVTAAQMSSLGKACGFMHKTLSQLPTSSVKGYPLPTGQQQIQSLWENYYLRMKEARFNSSLEFRKAVLSQKIILKQLKCEFFDRLPQGIAHEDFSPDNILFEGDRVSIIDFDRSSYSYLYHDMGRAILSLALEDQTLNPDKTNAFLKGYCQRFEVDFPDVADVLRLTWCLEIPWWIRPEFFEENTSPKIKRFRREMQWLTEHWFELEELPGF